MEGQQALMRKQAERLQEIWKLLGLQGDTDESLPASTTTTTSTSATTPGSMDFPSNKASLTASLVPVPPVPPQPKPYVFNVVPGIDTPTSISSTSTCSSSSSKSLTRERLVVAPKPKSKVTEATSSTRAPVTVSMVGQVKKTAKRKEISSPSVKDIVFIRQKRRRSIRATARFIYSLDLSPISTKKMKVKSSAPASRHRSSSIASPPITFAEKFESIVQVIPPESKSVCNKLAQCHTYVAVGKVITDGGSCSTTIDKRFTVVCAFCDKMSKHGKSKSNSEWYISYLGSSGATELFVQWLHDFSKYIYRILDDKITIMSQYLNGYNANARGIVDRFQICATSSKYIELLLLVLGEVSSCVCIVQTRLIILFVFYCLGPMECTQSYVH